MQRDVYDSALDKVKKEPLRSAPLDVADCCISLDEARGVIRRREKYANELMAWMNERRNAPDPTTLEMIQERLRPLCSNTET